jgi:hypothetical protein
MENSNVRRLADYVLKAPNQAAQGAVQISSPSSAPKPKLLDQVREAIRARHYSPRTEDANVGAVSDLPNSTNFVIAVRCRAIRECVLKECFTM